MTSLLKLIEEFSARETVPIEVDHIVDYLRAWGIKDEIYFFDPDINTEILKGSIVHWEYQSQGWTHKVADIYTARSLSLEEKRLVQAKELLHLLDHRIDRVNGIEDVEALIEQMALGISYEDSKTASDHADSDRKALLHVLPVIFPTVVRDLFLGLLKAQKIDIEEIADRVALPNSVVGFVMSDLWESVYRSMMEALRSEVPIPDRVHILDATQATMEVLSVPLEQDPYIYAKRVEERKRETDPVVSVVVETRREQRKFTASELMEYTPRSPLRRPRKA